MSTNLKGVIQYIDDTGAAVHLRELDIDQDIELYALLGYSRGGWAHLQTLVERRCGLHVPLASFPGDREFWDNCWGTSHVSLMAVRYAVWCLGPRRLSPPLSGAEESTRAAVLRLRDAVCRNDVYMVPLDRVIFSYGFH